MPRRCPNLYPIHITRMLIYISKEDGAKSPVSTSAKSKKRAAGDADGGPPTKKGRKSPVKAKAKAIIKPEPAVEDEAQDDDAAME